MCHCEEVLFSDRVCVDAMRPLNAVSFVSALVIAGLVHRVCWPAAPANPPSASPPVGDPYAVLGVPNDADRNAIVKAYRALALRSHPDRNPGDASADATFATISHAYEVLMDAEKREIFDRLGEQGLERLRDGDPSVKKDWLPPDEVLRRIHNDGDEPWFQSMITSSFASVGGLFRLWEESVPLLRRWFGVSEFPSVWISATDASGATLASGGSVSTRIAFKFTLSGKSVDFDVSDIEHVNCEHARFLGMKSTYYLECGHTPGQTVYVSVREKAFTVTDRKHANTASAVYLLIMV
jgi:DnaJ-class molecular chaperone